VGPVSVATSAIASRSDTAAPTAPDAATGAGTVQAAPSVPTWSGTFNGSITYASGLVPGVNGATFGTQLSAGVVHGWKSGGLSFDAALGYQKTAPAAAVMDQWALTLAARRQLTHRLSLVAQSKYDANKVADIESRSTTHVGLGVLAVQTPQVTLLLAPAIGYTHSVETAQGRLLSFAAGTPAGEEGVAGGGYELFIVQLAKGLTFQQTVLFLRGMDATPDTQRSFDSRIVGMVTPRLGVSIAYVNQYDSSIPAPVKNTLQTLNSGIQVRF
jgi:hypothetical protein